MMLMARSQIPMGVVSTLASVVSTFGFVFLATDRTNLTGAGGIDIFHRDTC